MKVLITGVSGQVGSAALEQFSENEKNLILGLSHRDLDISSFNEVMVAINEFQPDVIVNGAAMTNVDACEEKIDEAFAINSLGVRNLAQAADSVSAQLIHISTDFVFDGKSSRPYSEYDLTNPLSVYAKSKLGGDNEALAYSLGTVLRVAWVFGNPKGDFFSWVIDGVKQGTISSMIDDQISTPTYSFDIAAVIDYCAKHRLTGLLNVANRGEVTRLDMGKAVCDRLGIEQSLKGISADSLNRPAPRPDYSALSTDVLERTTGIQMRTWEEAMEDFVLKTKDGKL